MLFANVFIAVFETSIEDRSSRRVSKLKNVNRPVVPKTYFQSPQDQFSKRLGSQAWQCHSWIFRTSAYRLNTVCNTSWYTSWRLISVTGHQDEYGDLKTWTEKSLWRPLSRVSKQFSWRLTDHVWSFYPWSICGWYSLRVILLRWWYASKKLCPIAITGLTLNRKWDKYYLRN